MRSFDELQSKVRKLKKEMDCLLETRGNIANEISIGLSKPDDLTDIDHRITVITHQLQLIYWFWGGNIE